MGRVLLAVQVPWLADPFVKDGRGGLAVIELGARPDPAHVAHDHRRALGVIVERQLGIRGKLFAVGLLDPRLEAHVGAEDARELRELPALRAVVGLRRGLGLERGERDRRVDLGEEPEEVAPVLRVDVDLQRIVPSTSSLNVRRVALMPFAAMG
jgi:hypothetical protein